MVLFALIKIVLPISPYYGTLFLQFTLPQILNNDVFIDCLFIYHTKIYGVNCFDFDSIHYYFN